MAGKTQNRFHFTCARTAMTPRITWTFYCSSPCSEVQCRKWPTSHSGADRRRLRNASWHIFAEANWWNKREISFVSHWFHTRTVAGNYTRANIPYQRNHAESTSDSSLMCRDHRLRYIPLDLTRLHIDSIHNLVRGSHDRLKSTTKIYYDCRDSLRYENMAVQFYQFRWPNYGTATTMPSTTTAIASFDVCILIDFNQN